MTAIAVDDEPLALEVIKAFCSRVDFIDLKKAFTETGEALEYIAKEPVDLLFLDINMPSMTGIEFYKQAPKSTMVIFTTAFSEYAIEGFNLSAIDYLLKPFSFARFVAASEKAKEYHAFMHQKDTAVQQYLFVRVDYSMMKIAIADISYIEGLDNYVKLHFDNGKSQLVRMSMKAITEKLPDNEFLRVHRSYIVPLSRVSSVRNKIIHLGKTEIPVGTNYVEEVSKRFKE